jgi:hypothetical protein
MRSRRLTLRKNLQKAKTATQRLTPVDVPDEELALMRRLRAAAERLAGLAPDRKRLPVEVLDLARLLTGLDRGLLVLKIDGAFKVVAARGLSGASTVERAALQTVARAALKHRKALLDHDPRDTQSPGGLVVALPLGQLGVLVLHAPSRETPLSIPERSLARGFARQATLAAERLLAEPIECLSLRRIRDVVERAGGHLPTIARTLDVRPEVARALLVEAGVELPVSGRWRVASG